MTLNHLKEEATKLVDTPLPGDREERIEHYRTALQAAYDLGRKEARDSVRAFVGGT